MKGTLRLINPKLIRLGDFSGICFEFNGENYLCIGRDDVYVRCVNLNGPTIISLDLSIQIIPIDLEIIVI